MSDRLQKNILVWIGAITGAITIGGVFVMVGSLKGELITTIAAHSKLLDHHDNKLEKLSDDVSDLKARVHGVASQVGKIPGKVATALKPQNEN